MWHWACRSSEIESKSRSIGLIVVNVNIVELWNCTCLLCVDMAVEADKFYSFDCRSAEVNFGCCYRDYRHRKCACYKSGVEEHSWA